MFLRFAVLDLVHRPAHLIWNERFFLIHVGSLTSSSCLFVDRIVSITQNEDVRISSQRLKQAFQYYQ